MRICNRSLTSVALPVVLRTRLMVSYSEEMAEDFGPGGRPRAGEAGGIEEPQHVLSREWWVVWVR